MKPFFSRQAPPEVFSAEHRALVRAGVTFKQPTGRARKLAEKAAAAHDQFELDQSREMWRQVAALCPGAADAYLALASLWDHPSQALELLAYSADNLGRLDVRRPKLLFAPLLHVTVEIETPDDARLAWVRELTRHGKLDECEMWLPTVGPSVNRSCVVARLTFESGDNDQAVRRLQQITVPRFADDVHLLLAAALSRLELYGPARDKLELLVNHTEPRYRLAARYHLAYVHEQLNETELARAELERIYAERADYGDVAVRLGIVTGDPAPADPFEAIAREFMSGRVADDPSLGDNS